MVDLVKNRKKSKDSKEAAAASAAEVRPGVEPSSDAPAPVAAEAAPEEAPAAAPEPRSADEPAPQPAAPLAPEPAAAKRRSESAPPAVKKAAAPAPAPPATPAEEKPSPAVPPLAVEPVEEFDDKTEDRLARFKRLAGKRRTWTATPRMDEQGRAEEEERTELELLRFRVAGENYAVDIDKIVEIVPPRSTTRVPNADEAIVGIISLRGTIVTVIDLRRKLGHPKVDFQTLKDARMIVVERAGETAGFLVDLVSRVVKLDPSQLENHPVVSSAEQSEFVSGVFQSPDGLVILLDIERILAG
ncbi:MAG: chemotaxis protein CheW [Thermoanaerobaculia bacterium]|nr:chemotaxis protein CheW [Thermoanaerobaculia bacterium]